MMKFIIIFLFFIIHSSTSYSYIGPLVGLGVIYSSLIFVLILIVLLFGVIWFPIKKFLKKKNAKNKFNK